MRVLVAGAAGVVGSAIVDALAGEHDLVLLDRRPLGVAGTSSVQVDVRDWRSVRGALEPFAPVDALVSTVYAPTNFELGAEDNAVRQFDVTVKGTWILLEESARVGAKRFIYISTGNAYGGLRPGRTYTEDVDPLKNPDLDSAWPYGLCKLLAEHTLEQFCHTRGVSGISLRLGSVHAPGVMERRGIHVEDVAAAVRLALVVDTGTYEMMNLTSDTPRAWTVPNAKAKRQLGWEPKHDFEWRPELEDWSQPSDPPPDALPEPGP
jgi:nucleoside-diphosphate-sugar epimerase